MFSKFLCRLKPFFVAFLSTAVISQAHWDQNFAQAFSVRPMVSAAVPFLLIEKLCQLIGFKFGGCGLGGSGFGGGACFNPSGFGSSGTGCGFTSGGVGCGGGGVCGFASAFGSG